MVPPKKPHQYGSVCIYSWAAAPKTFTFNETLKDTRMQSILTTYCILTKSLITFLSGIFNDFNCKFLESFFLLRDRGYDVVNMVVRGA